MPDSIYSHEVTARTPEQRRQGHAALAYLRSDPPGAGTDNRWTQALHYRGVPYIAIEAIMSLVRGATYEVVRRKKARKGRTTFGPGNAVAKALPTAQSQGQDDEYIPFRDEDHPLGRMVCHGNGHETFGETSAKLVLQNRLTGVGPLWCVPNSRGKPVELWSLKTPLIYPIYQRSQEYPNGAWRIQPYAPSGWSGALPAGLTAAGATLPGEEVKRFLAPHPFVDWDGFSPLTAGARELDVLDAIEESRKAAMDNGLQLDAAYIAPGLDADQVTEIQRKVTEKMGGSRNARRFFVFSPPAGGTPNDKASLQTFGQSVRDMDYANGWEQSVKFCLALFGVPASIANLSQDTNYSERYAARQQFHDSQEDYLNCLGWFYTRVLAQPWSSFRGEYLVRVRPRPIDDKELREKQFTRQLSYDLLTYNEARKKDDLPPVEGGDVPVSLYVKQKEQELMPPQPPPGMPGDVSAPGQADADPLAALLGDSPEPSATLQKVTGPTAGAAPGPPNPAGAGSLPPRVGKGCGMGEAAGSAGGFLVPAGKGRRKRKRVYARKVFRKALQALEG